MKIVFIAGPFRGDGSKESKRANVEVARKYARMFVEHEIPFYSPHLNVSQEIIEYPEDRTKFAFSINSLFLNSADALAVLPGWKSSSGTKWEIQEAEKRSVPIFYLEREGAFEEITNWMHDNQ